MKDLIQGLMDIVKTERLRVKQKTAHRMHGDIPTEDSGTANLALRMDMGLWLGSISFEDDVNVLKKSET